MPVTEFAILPLTKENTSLPLPLLEILKTARQVLETASNYQFHYFQQFEDPSIIYIIGTWDSPAAHAEFLPSPENQQLLEIFKDDISTENENEKKKMSSWHLDSDVFKIGEGNRKSAFEAPIISCFRHFVTKEMKAGFEQKFNEVEHLLEEFTKPYTSVGGWRIEKETEGKEEWVLFSGFERLDQHAEFEKTAGFAKYMEIMGFFYGYEVRHLRAVKGL